MSEIQEKISFQIVTPSGVIVPDIIDKKATGKAYINWGVDNKLPQYLWDNYLKCSNLQAIINTITNYICGKGIEVEKFFEKQKLERVIQKCVFDYILFGGFAVECIRNKMGGISSINYLNVMNVRVNEELTTAYLSNKWGAYSGKDIIELPLFDKESKQNHFVIYYRGEITRNINPVPMYIAALKSIQILNNTRNFHLKNVENSFAASAIISINDTNIKAREMKEIKDKIEKQFCGSQNAGKFMVINSPDNEHSVSIVKLEADKFDEMYKALTESSVEDIYTAFRINKVLVGQNINTGFSRVEYEDIYNIYYETVIVPLQNNIIDVFNEIDIPIKFNKFNIQWSEK